LPKVWRRLLRSRFRPWVYGVQSLYGGMFLPTFLLEAAREFQPDAVFTVAGNWDWTALVAHRIAKELGLPLIASFNDWFDYGAFPAHPCFRELVECRFRRLYQEADLALCTSEGMREALGVHSNAYIWYPTGAPVPVADDSYKPLFTTSESPFTVFFGGSLGDWYGPMLESLVLECEERFPNIRFKIFGALQSWSEEFDVSATAKGVFGGRVTFEQLASEAAGADLLILPMGFGEECALVERTSFKTKFLDYLSFRRPILVWGPEYCSAVRVATEFDSGECVTAASPAHCAEAIDRLAANPVRRQALIDNAAAMYRDRFHPDKIHDGLLVKVRELIAGRREV
jgi:hypothetical protein